MYTMKKILNYILSFALCGFISFNAKAQIDFNQIEKAVPKPLYIEQYFKNTALLTNVKAKIIGSNDLYSIYQLPLDKMFCVVPNTQIKYHINVFNPEGSIGYSIDNIPNALPKVDLIK